MPVHQLSHRAIHAVFYRIVVERWTPSLREMLVIPREILGDYAVSRLTERYLSR
jgi:A/G-specific adenine glycosylase